MLSAEAIIGSAWAKELQTGADKDPQLNSTHGMLSSGWSSCDGHLHWVLSVFAY